ncbi:MAG: hypothetical protein AB7T49_11000 [Oligoflexales bacterium]
MEKAGSRIFKLLSWIVAIQSLGLAMIINGRGSSIGTFLFLKLRFSDSSVHNIELGLIAFLVALAVQTLVKPNTITLYLSSALILVESAFFTYNGGNFEAPFSLAGTSMRWTAPLILGALVLIKKRNTEHNLTAEDFSSWMMTLLLYSAAVTFVTHGVEALLAHPRFVDYIIGAGRKLLDFRIAQSSAETVLFCIGMVDVLVACLIVTVRWKPIAAYMTFWGMLTAMSRVVYFEAGGIGEFLIRAANWGVPLVIYLIWRAQPNADILEDKNDQTAGDLNEPLHHDQGAA